jgi:thiaminase (transcriptional activator TenA)
VSLAADLRAASSTVWEAQHAHPFVRSIGHATLDEQRSASMCARTNRILIDYGRLRSTGERP